MTPIDTIERYLAAARRGDWAGAYAFYAEDLRFRIPGRSSYAGEHEGRTAAIAYIERARALSSEHEVELEVVDVLAGAERVALLVRERFHQPGRVVDIRRANVYRVRDGRITEIIIYEGDQYEVDALLGA